MQTKNKLILIIGVLLIFISSAIITYFVLLNIGAIQESRILLKYEVLPIEKEYTGESFTVLPKDCRLVEGSLQNGHYAIFTIQGEIKEVGTKKINYTALIKNEENEDVTHEYKIIYAPANVSVTKKPLHIFIHQYDRDSTVLSYSDFEFIEGTSLVKGHKVAYQLTREITNGVESEVFTPFIVDSLGNDVTGNYQFNFEIQEKEVIDLTIKTLSSKKIYDGTAFSFPQFEIISGDLKSGHRIVVEFTKEEFVQKGIYINAILSLNIYDKNEKDVLLDYQIEFEYGSLEILARPLEVYGISAEKEYDGIDLELQGYNADLTKGLIQGHQLNVSYKASAFSNAGIFTSEISSCSIFMDDLDISQNYEIQIFNGKIKIAPRRMTLKTENLIKEYDGKPFVFDLNKIVIGNLLTGHQLTADFNYRDQKNVISDFNKLTNINLLDVNSRSVLINYEIEYNYGTFQIQPRKLLLVSNSLKVVYDGLDHAVTGYDSFQSSGLIKNHQIGAIIYEYDRKDKKNSGVINTKINQYEIKYFDEDVTLNYQVEVKSGMIEILPKKMKVKGISVEKVYDGEIIKLTNYDPIIEGIIAGHQIELTYKNDSYINAGQYETEIISCRVTFDDLDVSDNYELELYSGNVRINPRIISVRTKSLEKTYDSNPFVFQQTDILVDNIMANHTLQAQFVFINQSDVFTDYNELTDILIRDENRLNISHNYQINIHYGTLKIVKRQLLLGSSSLYTIYNGLEQSVQNYDILETSGILNNHSILVPEYEYSRADRIHVGMIKTKIKSFQIMQGITDVTGNYEVQIKTGQIEIAKYKLKLYGVSANMIYTGMPQNIQDYDLNLSTTPVNGHHISVIYRQNTLLNAGSYDSEIMRYQIKNILDEDVTGNYDVSPYSGRVIIEKLNLQVKGEDNQKIYDGSVLRIEDFTLENGTLMVHGHIFTILESDSMVNAGLNDLALIKKWIIVNQEGDIVTDNYAVSVFPCTLRVLKKNFTASAVNQSKIYDGLPLYVERVQLQPADLAPNHQFKIVASDSIINVSQKNASVTEWKIYDQNNLDVTDNYIGQISPAILIIEVREIITSSPSVTKVYDGRAIQCGTITLVSGSLAANHYILANFTNKQMADVGSAENRYTISDIVFDVMIDGMIDYESVYDNYYVTRREYGTLTILPDTALTILSETRVNFPIVSMSKDPLPYDIPVPYHAIKKY